jgi:hypothetical protein
MGLVLLWGYAGSFSLVAREPRLGMAGELLCQVSMEEVEGEVSIWSGLHQSQEL